MTLINTTKVPLTRTKVKKKYFRRTSFGKLTLLGKPTIDCKSLHYYYVEV